MKTAGNGKRTRISLLLLLLLSLFSLAVYLILTRLDDRPPRVTRTAIGWIEGALGQITEDEIEGMFGCPGTSVEVTRSGEAPEGGTYFKLWWGDRHFSLIQFTRLRVAVYQSQGLTRDPGTLERFWIWLGGDF